VSFMFRLILFVLIFSFIVYVLKMITRLGHNLRATITDVRKLRELFEGRSPVNAEMVRCQTCGAFVSPKEALTVSAKQTRQTYCSRQCLEAAVKTA
jgi:hypothetical protein